MKCIQYFIHLRDGQPFNFQTEQGSSHIPKSNTIRINAGRPGRLSLWNLLALLNGVSWAPLTSLSQPPAALPLLFCVRPPCHSHWCHCRRGKGTQWGPAGTVTLLRTAQAPGGRSPQPAPSVPGGKQHRQCWGLGTLLSAQGWKLLKLGTLWESALLDVERWCLEDSSPSPLRKGLPSFLKAVDPLQQLKFPKYTSSAVTAWASSEIQAPPKQD